jgi:hypothetical protein
MIQLNNKNATLGINDTKHIKIQHNNKSLTFSINDTRHYNTRYNDTQNIETQHNNKSVTLSITTLSMMKFSKTTLSMTITIQRSVFTVLF